MAQFSTDVLNAMLDAIETTIGASAILRIFTGTKPANCAAADSGTQLAQITCPSDYLAAAAAAIKSKSGTWQGTAGDDGTAGHFRIYEGTGTTCKWQGNITVTGGGGDMEVNNTDFANGQTFTITAVSLNLTASL